jgi:hypothetical protein
LLAIEHRVDGGAHFGLDPGILSAQIEERNLVLLRHWS